MKRSVTAVLLAALGIALAGCGWLEGKKDERREWLAQDWYRAAKEELDSGNWLGAVKLYGELESKYPFGRFAQQAQLDTAYAYYKEGDTAQSISAIDRFMKAYPNHRNLDYALYLKALANFREDLGPLASIVGRQDLADRDPKAARESFELFKELVTRYPGSRYVDDSRSRMEYLVDALARHEVHVARYYLKRGAWLSAVNRAQDILVRFPGSPERREALEIIVEGYDRMGMPDLRDGAKKVLAANYPAVPLAQEGKNRSAWWSWPWW
ncbi:MAG: outer membrane protein assembly factor BamD [Betaproteobacteria bacterium]|nr:outer membrane protein assembly factor BamD [Betaproteobacteria bacterium]